MQTYDYIIVGAGSAGCVLANRLSADPSVRVLLLEAGGKDSSILYRMPAGVGSLITGGKGNWCYETEGQEHLNYRRLFWPRGKVLGGSSSINGMIYIRGHARDYDHWRQLGLEGWGFSDVLPYFKRSEDLEFGGDNFHGEGGPLKVSSGKSTNPLFRTFVEAGRQAGHPFTDDFNGYQQEGMGFYQLTIRDGKRQSTAVGYLRPALDRDNLTVEVEALTSRIVFEGKKAVGVDFMQKGEARTVRAEREVILCGGAVNTPQTLLLSGVGDADYLKRFGIDVVADLPGVGKNLQDHLDCSINYECTQPITLYSQANPFRALATGMQYVFSGKGLGQTNGLEAGGFLKTRPELEMPDIQLHFIAANMFEHGKKKMDRHGFMAHICQLRPESRGEIALKSTNPSDPPLIQPNYLATENDRITLREGVKMVREIFGQEAFDAYRGPEIQPGAHVQSDEKLDEFIRRNAETIYHPVGTAKMGTDKDAVVDAACKVHGIDGLRVVDASVMPTLVGGNTNAPTIMIAEKVSDMILGKPALPSEVVEIAEDKVKDAAA